MRTCPSCGASFSDTARFCPQDGAVLVSVGAPEPRADALIGRLLDGRYRIEERLGEGGMGTVYRGCHALMGRPVAVKVMRADVVARPDMALRFRREAMLTSRLDHEHCVRVVDVSPEGGEHAYLVMELLEGEDLRRVLRRGPIPPRRAVEIAASAASALAHAHALDVVHRDLKPDNVFLHRRGGREVVKVLDFGIARGAYEETITRAGEVFGTPEFMSPEQASDPAHVDSRSDLYSLGATTFAMLTGQSPVADRSAVRALALVLRGEVKRHPRTLSPNVPPWLDALVARCLACRPDERPESSLALEEELRRGLETMPPEPPSITLAPRPVTATDPRAVTHVTGGVAPDSSHRRPPTADPRVATRSVGDDAPRSWPPGSQAPGHDGALAERRQLTVMVGELVNLAELTERLDVDDLRDVLRAFRAVCEEVISAAGGRMKRSMDSSMLAYLGYPQAHEDDAARAVDAALEIVKKAQAIEVPQPPGMRRSSVPPIAGDPSYPPSSYPPSSYPPSSTRGTSDGARLRVTVAVGLHSGEVLAEVTGVLDRADTIELVGMPPAVAARLASAAGPNEVVVSAATHALIQGGFRCEGRRHQTIPGLSLPLATYRVLEGKQLETRFARKLTGALSPFVGRGRQVEMLWSLWQDAQAGAGQVVLLSGDAGVGKSRVVQELKQRLQDARAPHTVIDLQCWEHWQGSALRPFIVALAQILGLRPGDTDPVRQDRIDAFLHDLAMDVQATAPLLAGLLSVRDDGRHPRRELGLARLREETGNAVVSLLLRVAEQAPLVLVAEDLHWVDPSTLELLGHIVDQAPSARLLVIGTLRPEYADPSAPRPPGVQLALAARSHVVKLPLGRLSDAEVGALLDGLAGKPLPAALVDHLMQNSDGMPLFVEETVKMLLESGVLVEGPDRYTLAGQLPAALAPASLQDSLMARLDRLSTAKETAQRAAVIGRELSFSLLRALSPGHTGALQVELRRLVDAGLLIQKGMLPEATFLFKHALVQDTAYRSIPRRRQHQIHQDVARALEQHFPAVVETQPELLAHHFTEAGLASSALGYWVRAGQRAFERAAHVEAGGHFRRALALLEGLPPGPERDQRERAVQVALGASLMATQGYAGPDVARAYARARALAGRGGDVREQFAALRGTWLYYTARGAHDTAAELVHPMRALADACGDRGLVLQSLYPAGVTALHRGDLAAADRDLRRAISLYDKEEERRSPRRYGVVDPGVGSLSYVGAHQWMIGQPDEGLATSKEAVLLAKDLRDSFSVAYASFGVSIIHQLRGEPEATREWAEATLEVSTRERYPFWLRMAAITRAWANAALSAGAITEVLAALAGYRATGAELWRTTLAAAAADLCVRAGKLTEGLELCAEGLDVGVARGERLFHAELLRVQGELLRSSGDEAAAQASLLSAREEAQRCGARALELRVADSLAGERRRLVHDPPHPPGSPGKPGPAPTPPATTDRVEAGFSRPYR